MKLNQLRQRCRDRFHDYVVFKKAMFFILGLILSYKLVEKTFLNILITYLSDAWKDCDLRRANAVVNLQEGTSAVLVTFFAYAADVYTGRFKMVVFSTVVCIIGLLLSRLATGKDEQLDLRLFFPTLGLMTLAQAALTITLQAFLDDQLRPIDSSPDDDAAWRRRSEFWWIFVSFVAAILAQFGPLSRLDLSKLTLELTAVMGVFFLLFLLGSKYYNLVGRIQNPFKDVGIVILGAIAMRKVEYPQTQAGYFLQTQEGLFDNSCTGDVHISPHVPWLRWLDKAAIGPTKASSSVEKVCRVKLLLKMLPLWSCFLTFSLVVASGSTFFLEEALSLTRDDDERPILFFTNLQRFTEFVVSVISSSIIKKLIERKQNNEQKMELVRIGVGMSCCVPCCIAAWATAARRQHDKQGNMSVYLLTPQYLLLGLMAGLSQEGLESFYESQVLGSLSTYGPPFGEFIMGVGKFLSILCILILSTRRFKWFDIDLSNSRLSKYYILLAVLSFGNFIIYCLVARWYGDDAFLLEDVVPDVEMGVAHQADQLLDDGLASRSNEGQHISLRTLSHRTVSRTYSGDVSTEISYSGSGSGSGSKQEEEEAEETPEEKLLTTKNSTDSYLLQLRGVTMFLRLLARKRTDPNLLKND